jgi:hypothetical protein
VELGKESLKNAVIVWARMWGKCHKSGGIFTKLREKWVDLLWFLGWSTVRRSVVVRGYSQMLQPMNQRISHCVTLFPWSQPRLLTVTAGYCVYTRTSYTLHRVFSLAYMYSVDSVRPIQRGIRVFCYSGVFECIVVSIASM